MSYDLIDKEDQYLSELKEMKTLNTHVGSGPIEKAPKEKEVKSPEADTKGVGTQQAGTKDAGKIPSIPALKKELAKEDMSLADELEFALEMCGKDHSKDKEKVKEGGEKCPGCGMNKKDCKCPDDDMKCAECGKEKDKCECKDKEEVKEQVEGAEKEEKDEEEAEEAEEEKEEEEVKEQELSGQANADAEDAGDAPKDSDMEEVKPGDLSKDDKEVEEQLSLKQQNRMSGSSEKRYVPGSPAEADAAAARKDANRPVVAIKPMGVQKSRRPIVPPGRQVRMGRV